MQACRLVADGWKKICDGLIMEVVFRKLVIIITIIWRKKEVRDENDPADKEMKKLIPM